MKPDIHKYIIMYTRWTKSCHSYMQIASYGVEYKFHLIWYCREYQNGTPVLKGYFPNLLETSFLHQIFVFRVNKPMDLHNRLGFDQGFLFWIYHCAGPIWIQKQKFWSKPGLWGRYVVIILNNKHLVRKCCFQKIWKILLSTISLRCIFDDKYVHKCDC